MSKRIEHKLITLLSRANVITSKGKCLGPIYPYIEDVDQIRLMIRDQGLNVYEVNDGKLIKLTLTNYDQDNSTENPTLVLVTGVSLDQTSKQLEVGDNLTLVPKVSPDDATNKSVSWSTNSNNVATVSNGLVTAKDIGSAVITVKTEDGNHMANCDITVIRSVTGVTLTPTTVNLNVSDSIKLTPTLLPDNPSNKNVTWSSSETGIVTVNDGTITGLTNGKASITVTTVDGNHTASCEVTVATPVTGVSLNSASHSIKVGESITLVGTVAPTTASNKNVTWSSSDQTVATVANGVVNALANGKTTITISTVDGNHTATCEVTVTTSVTSISLDANTKAIKVGDTFTLVKNVLPTTASNKSVTWSSSEQSVASVNDGNVTALTNGKTNIVATTVDGNHTATCEVTVTTSTTGVVLDRTSHSMNVDDTIKLVPTISPNTSSNKNVTWESNSPDVVKVDNGTITALSKGNAVITVKTEDGNHTATCDVTSIKPVIGVTLDKSTHSMNVGETIKLSPTLEPSDASNTSITWESGDPEVVSVSDGTVTGLTDGKTNITVKTVDGNHTATCEVTITTPPTQDNPEVQE